MNILIINPPAYKGKEYIREGRCMQMKGSWSSLWPPLTLTYINAILRKEGHNVKLIDATADKLDYKDLKDKIIKFRPQAIVINTGFPSVKGDLELSRIAKSIDQGVKTIAIGMFPTTMPEYSLNYFKYLDFVILHEPESVVKELIHELEIKKSQEDITTKGVGYRRMGKIIVNKKEEYFQDLNKLPFPLKQGIDNTRYVYPFDGKNFSLINIARGCPYDCVFCLASENYGKKLRKRSIRSIIDEIKHCINIHKIEYFLLWSESFSLDKYFAENLCNAIIKSKINVKWMTNSRIGELDSELLNKMKKAGCFLLSYGIETGSQEITNQSLKNQKVEDVKKTINLTKKVGIETIGHFIFGLPGETKDSAKETMKLSKNIGLDYAQFYCAVPYPGTNLHKLAKENNWIMTDNWDKYETAYSIMNNKDLSADNILKYREMSFRLFYLRPKILFNNLIKIRRPVIFFEGLLEFLKWSFRFKS